MVMKTWKMLTLAMVLVLVAAPLLVAVSAWLGPSVMTGVVTVAPLMGTAVLLVLYFRWRARFTRHMLDGDDDDPELARAA